MLTRHFPEVLLPYFNQILVEGTFPTEWKRGTLVLIPKSGGGEAPGHPSTFRPICLLNTIAKLAEIVIDERLKLESERVRALSHKQHGFRTGKSTIRPLKAAVEAATKRQTGSKGRLGCTAIALLDVSNAFNSASWQSILDAMRNKGFPEYLTQVISAYLSDRTVWAPT